MRSGHFVKYSREKNIDSKFFKCLVNNYGYYNKNYNAIDKLVLYLAFIWKERCNICMKAVHSCIQTCNGINVLLV